MPVLEELPSYSRLSEAVVAAEGCELHLADGRRLLVLHGDAFDLTMKGPVSEVYSGRLTPAFVRELK